MLLLNMLDMDENGVVTFGLIWIFGPARCARWFRPLSLSGYQAMTSDDRAKMVFPITSSGPLS
jgi:hypothetical protein